jgi:uncharacterized protein (DUF4415 family)
MEIEPDHNPRTKHHRWLLEMPDLERLAKTFSKLANPKSKKLPYESTTPREKLLAKESPKADKENFSDDDDENVKTPPAMKRGYSKFSSVSLKKEKRLNYLFELEQESTEKKRLKFENTCKKANLLEDSNFNPRDISRFRLDFDVIEVYRFRLIYCIAIGRRKLW